MDTDDNALKEYRNFPGINEAWELEKTGIVVLHERLYKLEVWHSYSNPDLPYFVSICIQENGVWKKIPDPPFPVAPRREEALRDAMAFLAERVAA
jgi:hypothetical protein